jgi:hypothetical protein
MKRTVFSFIGLAAIAGVAIFNVSLGSSNGSLSDLALANIEALAQNEGGGSKGTLYGNSSGTRYCCCAGNNDCGAVACSNCP